MSRHSMRRALHCCVLAAMLGFLVPRPARADLKIAFIDSDRIFAEYAKTKEAQELFNRDVQDLATTAREKKTAIDDLQRKLDSQGPMLSEAKREEQNLDLQKKVADYEEFVQKNWGPGGSVSRLNEDYLRPILDRVHRIVTDIGTDEGYSLILDAADGNIVFGDKTFDLTDRVLGALRDEDAGKAPTRPGRGGQPSPSGTPNPSTNQNQPSGGQN
jgi:outer membrane protein